MPLSSTRADAQHRWALPDLRSPRARIPRPPLQSVLLLFSLLLGAASGGPAVAAEPSRDVAAPVALEETLAEVEELLAEAHYLTMIGVAESASRWAAELPPTPDVLEGRARLHVLIATAQVALGREDRATKSLRRAIELDSKLVLTPQTASPKLVRVFRKLQPDAPARPGSPR
jgi:hypothetical protein